MQDTRNNEYNKWAPIWEYTRDAIEGQDAIKSKSSKYLPMLNGQTPDSYQAYLKRAQYVNFSSRYALEDVMKNKKGSKVKITGW